MKIQSNWTIPGHPHPMDLYFPSNAKTLLVCLHGGAGTKEDFAFNLGLKTDNSNTNYDISEEGKLWLIAQEVGVLFPQGQSVTGLPLEATWTNHVMNSGVDDVSFLQDLVAYLKFDTNHPPINKLFLLGHSNGGMMVHRMWCESPNTFDAYASFAGPPSVQLHPVMGSHPCHPAMAKPYLAILGDSDTVLQTTGNMGKPIWTINPLLTSNSPAWENDHLLNDAIFHATRVGMLCAEPPNPPTTLGQVTTYSDCSNKIALMIVSQATVGDLPSGGDHCIATQNGTCTTTLAGETGLDLKSVAMDFFLNQP